MASCYKTISRITESEKEGVQRTGRIPEMDTEMTTDRANPPV